LARGGAQALSPVAAHVAARSGSSLSPQQASRLRDVLVPKLCGRTEQEFLRHLQSPGGAADLADLMGAIAVHKTDLFRDEVQLDSFVRNVLTPMARASSRPLHLWSAGCATGEEVATLLILLSEAGAHSRSTVLGTDISLAALQQARDFRFHPALLRRVPEPLRDKYFRKTHSGFELVQSLRARASFARHNLMDRPYPFSPGGQGFDVIFCRNVLIYFTEPAMDRVVDGLAEQLKPGGVLVLSAAEPLLKPNDRLETVRCERAFFYHRADPRQRATPARPPPPARARAPAAVPQVPAIAEPPPPERAPPEQGTDAREEANRIFELVLEWAAAGDAERQTEEGLRRCLYLDPHFAQARYLLGMVLEHRGDRADAAAEYRRALAALTEGKARQTPFFLNEERLKVACVTALARLGFR